MSERARVLVIGGGVSGLSAAHRLLEVAPDVDVEVWEASERAGGWIATERVEVDGAPFVVDLGPESIVRDKPAALALVRRLGLEDRVVHTRTDRRGAYVVCRGRLTRIPEGFSLLGPGDLLAFVRSSVISPAGKARAAMELGIPRQKREPNADESLASFVRRRFGWEVLERLAQPLVSGIYGADAEALGLGATMPRFLEMETRDGSVTRALVSTSRRTRIEAGSGARYGLFFSFDGGMAVLTDALAARLGSRLRLRKRATSIEATDGACVVRDDQGALNRFDRVVVALPAGPAAALFSSLDPLVARELESIAHGSAATVTLVFRRADVPHPLDAYGFVVPRVERRRILAATWSSEKWPGRAPASHALLRVFSGGDDPLEARDDDLLVFEARRELADLLGITATPRFAKVVRYPSAMPLYDPRHLARTSLVTQRLDQLTTVALAGNSVFGVGIPDAVASGERAAERVVRALEPAVGVFAKPRPHD